MAADLYIGIMSGTSLDGVDAAMCRFGPAPDFGSAPEFGPSPQVEVLGEASIEWPGTIREMLYRLATEETVATDELARAHFLLPRYYAEVTSKVISAANVRSSDVRAIGVHGQTIRHLPDPVAISPSLPAVGATLQLGSPAALAALTGIDVVGDFRSADVALCGQGAPLVPMFDRAFLSSSSIDRVALNIGGIANITWLPADESRNVIAFDTGPGNMIIDSLTREFFGRPYDASGEIARGGKVDQKLLEELLSHDYFKQSPPKSTGRELFGREFLSRFFDEVRSNRLSSDDAIATATELTARSIANEISSLSESTIEVLASGGGAKNVFLLERLARLLPRASVRTTETVGIPAQSKEAIAFAYFAFAFVSGIRIHLPQTTGASRSILLGSLSRGA